MKQKTRKTTFDVYLPATADSAPVFAETIEVEVYKNYGEDFLTPESSELIERTQARHLGFLHGKDIRDLRKRLGLTQDQLSDLLDCGKKSLSRWESGRGLPSGIVNKLLRLLDEGYVTPESLTAVMGPRTTKVTPFSNRPTNVIHCDFSARGPSKSEVDAWLRSQSNQPEAASL